MLKKTGITNDEYILDVTESGVEILSVGDWNHVYICTNCTRKNQRVEKGNSVDGDIIAKFYQTWKKIKAHNIVTQNIGVEEIDEYILVITGSGKLGPLFDEGAAWFAEEVAEYGFSYMGVTKLIILGEITNIVIGDGVISVGSVVFWDAQI